MWKPTATVRTLTISRIVWTLKGVALLTRSALVAKPYGCKCPTHLSTRTHSNMWIATMLFRTCASHKVYTGWDPLIREVVGKVTVFPLWALTTFQEIATHCNFGGVVSEGAARAECACTCPCVSSVDRVCQSEHAAPCLWRLLGRM